MGLLPQPNFCISVEIPVIRDFRLSGRNQSSGLWHTFYPPASTFEWPKTTTDVDNSFLRSILVDWLYGPGAIGSKAHLLAFLMVVVVDGKVYTNDLPFWLSLVKSGQTYRVVYGIFKTFLATDRFHRSTEYN